MTTVYHYRIYCNDELKFVDGFGAAAPTVCYNNNTHVVNAQSVQQLETISANQVWVQEEQLGHPTTGGHYGCWAFSFDAAANTTTDFISNFPYPISMLSCQLQVSPDMVGDRINFALAPNTTVGYITAAVAAAATVIPVNSTVIANVYVGLELRLTNGVTTDMCGRILSIDPVASTVTVETATTHAFSMAPTTYVRVTRYFVKNHDLRVSQMHQIGFSKIGGGYVSPSINGLCSYTNNSTTVKKITFSVEHLY